MTGSGDADRDHRAELPEHVQQAVRRVLAARRVREALEGEPEKKRRPIRVDDPEAFRIRQL